jgi:spore germination cell wall hydrolase CwlJ-like protein
VISRSEAGADRRRLIGAALTGSGLGLALGAVYLAAGLAGTPADAARSQRLEAAVPHSYEAAAVPAAAVAARASGRSAADPPSKLAAKIEKKPKRARELECLAQAVYYEARGENPNGQFAVAQVVMNRVRHPAFPKSVCAVVFQGAGRRGCQFSFACDGSMRGRREASAWTRARKVASRVLAGAAIAEVGAATHFHTTGVSPAWGPQMRRVAQLGMHVFYRFNPRRPKAAEPAPAAVESALLTAQAIAAPQDLQLQPTLAEGVSSAPAAGAEAAAEPAQGPAASEPADAGPGKASQPADVTAS